MKPETVKKKSIVLSINSLQGAGAERFVITIGDAFKKLGFDVHIICFDPLIEYTLDGSLTYHLINHKRLKHLGKGRLKHFLLSKITDKYIEKNIGKPVLILSNLDRSYKVFRYSKLTNIVYVIHNTLSLLYKFESAKNIEKLKAEFIDIFSRHPCVCVSEGVKEDFVQSFGDITPTYAIHNPIDKDKIIALSQKFNPDYKNYILHVGSFKEAKRHDVLIKAYAKTKKSLPLLLLGKGKLQGEVEQLVIELGLEEKVIFLGFCENPYPYIKNAALKVLTSEWEGFALVIPEALALGVPVISTDCRSGPRELLPENNLMQTNNIEAIALKLDQAMADPQQFKADFNNTLLPKVVASKYLKVVNK